MKLTLQRLLILLALIPLSILFGLGYDAAATAIEKSKYPIDPLYAEMILEQANAFGVPPAILWATVRQESDFVSNKVSEDGSIGLMQITPALLDSVCRQILNEPTPDTGMLYDPATNLRIGAAWLSALYEKYGMWESVYAAWHAGTGSADFWLSDPECLNEQGRLTYIPDEATAKFVSRMKKSAEMYTKLYYE
ncbi:MAG: lytic transglycosylase domain-containing protein [Ruminococcaceae bacterium]|nr:lytic transglycosylase domain-containing protein [Oscillospiraceae bacterium]